MDTDFVEFRRGVIAPLECIKEGWALIKDQYWLFFGITVVGCLLAGIMGIVSIILLMGPMMVGIFLCFQQRQRNQPVDFGLLFKGFEQFVPGLIASLLKMIPIFILIIPYYIVMVVLFFLTMPRESEPSLDAQRQFLISFFGLEIGFALTIVVVSLLTEIFFMLAYPLIADKKLSGLEAVKLSLRAAKANFAGILGLLLLNGVFSFVGLLCCFVGVYLYLPVAYAAQAVAYRRIFSDTATTYPSPPPPPGDWT